MSYESVINPWRITSEQVRAARAVLRWEQKMLVEKSGVSLATIKRLEGQNGVIDANRPTLQSIRSALESVGLIFVDENGEGPGIRMSAAKQCALELVTLAQKSNSKETIDKAKQSVERYADRERRGHSLAFNEVMLLYRDDHGSDTPAGNAIFKWLESEIVGRPSASPSSPPA